MGGGIHPTGQPADHGDAAGPEVGGEPLGHPQPVGGPPTGADDGDGQPVLAAELPPDQEERGREIDGPERLRGTPHRPPGRAARHTRAAASAWRPAARCQSNRQRGRRPPPRRPRRPASARAPGRRRRADPGAGGRRSAARSRQPRGPSPAPPTPTAPRSPPPTRAFPREGSATLNMCKASAMIYIRLEQRQETGPTLVRGPGGKSTVLPKAWPRFPAIEVPPGGPRGPAGAAPRERAARPRCPGNPA